MDYVNLKLVCDFIHSKILLDLIVELYNKLWRSRQLTKYYSTHVQLGLPVKYLSELQS